MDKNQQHKEAFKDSLASALNDQDLNKRLYAPVMTFHPKIDLLDPDLAEIHASAWIAEACGQVTKFIPYTYDLGFRSGQDRILSPVSVQYENESTNMLSDNRVGKNPLCLIEGFNKKRHAKIPCEHKGCL